MQKLRILIFTLMLVALGCGAIVLLYAAGAPAKDFFWGAHFSKSYTRELGLDWRVTYEALLDDLEIKRLRLSAQWDEVEGIRGEYDFADLDWQMTRAAQAGAEIVLAVGRRTPRWPECHEPIWTIGLSEEEISLEQLKMVEVVVKHFKQYDNLRAWQVENEPFLNVFGECPPRDPELLAKEISLVRSLDARPIMVTDSGELGWWRPAAIAGDVFGTTLYRVVINPFLGTIYYNFPPLLYNLKARLIGVVPAEAVISELQGEPWSEFSLTVVPAKELRKTMDALRLRRHAEFARKTGFGGAYFWGAEWWYFMKEKRGDDTLWQEAKRIFQEW